MSANCSHEECEPYRLCVIATDRERRQVWWYRRAQKWPTDQCGTDPLAYVDGATPGE